MAARLFNWKMPDGEWDLLEREVKTGLAPNKSARIRRLLAQGRAHEATCTDDGTAFGGPCPRCAHLKDWQLVARASSPASTPPAPVVDEDPWSEGSWA